MFFLKTVKKEYREKRVEREYSHLPMLNYLVLCCFTGVRYGTKTRL